MRKSIGIVCMTVGILLLIGALTLLIWNNVESSKAEQSSNEVVSQLKDAITDSEKQSENSSDVSDTPTKERQTTEIEIDSYDYIGYLSIPALGLELPVMSSWDYQRLKVSPCRYSGNKTDKNLVVIAHNYSGHFGNLDQLQFEDEVLFTDVTGEVTTYQVACVDVVPPSSAEEVVSGDFDLALVTCTYGGKTRFVVYCDES